MDSDVAGTMRLIVKIPDYTALYCEAGKTDNPEAYIQNALEKKQYEICEREIMASVTVENGKRVIHKDEAVIKLLDKEFNDATNALLGE